jgi:hypothetical protein
MKLLDDDGENGAVRWFLACYGHGGQKTIGTMKANLEMAGFEGCWPDWCNAEHPSAHLTKGGAQLWIRHLFSLEAQQVAVPAGYVLVTAESLRDIKCRVNTLATLSLKAERYSAGREIKQDIADMLAAAPQGDKK